MFKGVLLRVEPPVSSNVDAALARGAHEVFSSSSLNSPKPARDKLSLGHLCQVWLKMDSPFLSSWG